MVSVEVQNRIMGAVPDDLTVPTVILELGDVKITVSQLIRQTVSQQIDHLLADLQYEPEQVQRALDRRYLTQAEVDRQAGMGKVSAPITPRTAPPVNKQKEIKKARDAFKQGAYIIVVDGQQVMGLNEVITLKPDSKINFVRLMPLRGG